MLSSVLQAVYSFFYVILSTGWVLITFVSRPRRRQYLKRRLKDALNWSELQSADVLFHAVSLGEAKLLAPMASEIQKLSPDYKLTLQVHTQTGYQWAKLSNCFNEVIFAPFDLQCICKKRLLAQSPQLVIISELDLWPNFLRACERLKVPVISLNAKLSKRSSERLRWFPLATAVLHQKVSHFFTPSNEASESLKKIGISEQRVTMVGDFKLDAKQLTKGRGLHRYKRSIIFSCTHHGEEELLLTVIKLFLSEGWKVLVAPRHPERFAEVARLLSPLGVACYSSCQNLNNKLTLVDRMGLLETLYCQVGFAVLCGSYLSHLGGHNVLEPLHSGAKVIVGPYLQHQPSATKLVKEGVVVQFPLEKLTPDAVACAQFGCLNESISSPAKEAVKIIKKRGWL